MEQDEVRRYLEVATLAAREAGAFIQGRWGEPRDIEHKHDDSLVTGIDRGSEELIRDLLHRHTPECAILAEEQGVSGRDTGDGPQRWWYVDPVDGTTNLAHGFPWIAVSIALVERQKPVVGVVHNPILGHTFTAGRGLGARLGTRTLSVTHQTALSRALVSTGFGVGSHGTEHDNVANIRRVLSSCYAVRRCGAAALDLASVAAGWYDGYWELGLSPWDTAAGWILVEEAGGRVTRIDGTSPFDAHGPSILATNGRIHGELAEVLMSARAQVAGETSEPGS